MFFFIKEKRAERPAKQREKFWKNFKSLDGQLQLYLAVSFLFTLGNSSNAYLLLKAKARNRPIASSLHDWLLHFADSNQAKGQKT